MGWNLDTRRRGYAVMTADLGGISIDGENLEELKRYCRDGYVIVERLPAINGFSMTFRWHGFHKKASFKYSEKNILWLHWRFDYKYFHKTGKIVWQPKEKV